MRFDKKCLIHPKTTPEESNERNSLIDRRPKAVVLASKQAGQCSNRTAAVRPTVVKTFENKARAYTYIIAYRNYMRHSRGTRVRKNVNSEIMVQRGRQRERYQPYIYADMFRVVHNTLLAFRLFVAGGNRAFRFRPT